MKCILISVCLWPFAGLALNEKWSSLGYSCKDSDGKFTGTTAPEQGNTKDDIISFYPDGRVVRTMVDLGGQSEWRTIYHEEGSPWLDGKTGEPIIDEETGRPMLHGPDDPVLVKNKDGELETKQEIVILDSYNCELKMEADYTERRNSIDVKVTSFEAKGECPDDMKDWAPKRGAKDSFEFERNNNRVYILLPDELFGNKCKKEGKKIYEAYSVKTY